MDYSINYSVLLVYVGIGAFLALLAWRAFNPKRSWPKLLNCALSAWIVLLAAAMILPPPAEPRRWHFSLCEANLRMIQAAKAEWAREFKKSGIDVPLGSDLYGPTKDIRAEPVCPAGGTYRLGAVQEDPTCSYGQPGHRLSPVPKPRPISRPVPIIASTLGLGAVVVVVPATLLAARSRRCRVVR